MKSEMQSQLASTNSSTLPTSEFPCLQPPDRPITVEDIKREAELKLSQLDSDEILQGLLVVKSANSWIDEAKGKQIPKKLFDHFWLENEICSLFSDTNLGKSILAVQIGDSITTGKPVRGFTMEADQQAVLYFDFELSSKQFENRYSIDYRDHYTFSPDFYRAELNPHAAVPKRFERFQDYLHYALEDQINKTEAKCLIIDNMTYLEKDAEKAKNALPLMQKLKSLQRMYGLSILVLGHIPKRFVARPLVVDDLYGSKMISNFLDSAFAIGQSSEGVNHRYFKQVKQRNSEKVYHAENVCLCEISKPGNFVKFELRGYGVEQDYFGATTLGKEERIEIAKKLCSQGKTYRQIADAVGVSHQTIKRDLEGTI